MKIWDLITQNAITKKDDSAGIQRLEKEAAEEAAERAALAYLESNFNQAVARANGSSLIDFVEAYNQRKKELLAEKLSKAN